MRPFSLVYYFYNNTAPTEIYTLSLHDALPIWGGVHARAEHAGVRRAVRVVLRPERAGRLRPALGGDRKSTRLNSSHSSSSYAVFCLKKKMLPGKILCPFAVFRLRVLSPPFGTL